MDQRGTDIEAIRVLQALRAMRINWGDDPWGIGASALAQGIPAIDLPAELIDVLGKMSKPAMRSLLIEVIWRLREDLPQGQPSACLGGCSGG